MVCRPSQVCSGHLLHRCATFTKEGYYAEEPDHCQAGGVENKEGHPQQVPSALQSIWFHTKVINQSINHTIEEFLS